MKWGCKLEPYSKISSSSKSFFALTVVFQEFKANVDHESYAILGNDVLIKCELPSFVADMVTVANWHDSEGNEYHPGSYGNFMR